MLYLSHVSTPFEMRIFWPSDTENRIKQTFSESVSLSFKTRLMTLLNVSQEKSNTPNEITIKMDFFLGYF